MSDPEPLPTLVAMKRLDKRRRHWMQDVFSSPYGLKESLGVIWRNAFPAGDLQESLRSSPQHVIVTPDLPPLLRVGLVGDIMDLHKRALQWDKAVPAFFRDCDVLVGNLEAMIAVRKTRSSQEMHETSIMNWLGLLCDPERFCLSVCNNHAADFGPHTFLSTCRKLTAAGFQVFGQKEQPYVDFGEHLRVITGSMWTNMPCDYIADYDDLEKHLHAERFNLFYPHWGYEMEAEPRAGIVSEGERLLARGDALVGNHSHLPQPVRVAEILGQRKVLAPSLGDFCSGESKAIYHHGSMLKFTCGRTPTGAWAVGELDWRLIGTKLTELAVQVVIPPDLREVAATTEPRA